MLADRILPNLNMSLSKSEPPPPWRIFPDIEPEDLSVYLKQGASEISFDEVWRPFWRSLSADQRDDYLSRWQASESWCGAILFFFDQEWERDIDTDAAESEQPLVKAVRLPRVVRGWLACSGVSWRGRSADSQAAQMP